MFLSHIHVSLPLSFSHPHLSLKNENNKLSSVEIITIIIIIIPHFVLLKEDSVVESQSFILSETQVVTTLRSESLRPFTHVQLTFYFGKNSD